MGAGPHGRVFCHGWAALAFCELTFRLGSTLLRCCMRSEPSPRGEIEFENVSFRYTRRSGETVGVGGSSGKSTLMDMLQRFHVPTSGQSQVDCRSKTALRPAWLSRQWVLIRNTELFDRSVRDNIARAGTGMTDDQADSAVRLAREHGVIKRGLGLGDETEDDEGS